jgi:hypothetical protein
VGINNDADYHVYILTYTISVKSQPTMKMNIHNQCSDFKLKNQRYFNTCASWDDKLDGEIDTGSMTNASLTPSSATFGGTIIYELQRKRVESDDQLKSTYTLLSIAWKSEVYKKFCVFVQLTDCDKAFSWHKVNPEKYYQRYANHFSIYTAPIKYTWLIHDGTVLMTRLELDFTQRDGVLSVTVSEGSRDEHTKISAWFGPKR